MYMKKCPNENCNNLIKNSYQQCYECNNKKDDSSDAEPSYKKEAIPKTVRNVLWTIHHGNKRTAKCLCCLIEDISISNYHVSHIVAEANGGKTSLDNLMPCCMLCNTSMGKQNMNDFIKKYNLHYRIEK